VFTNTVTGGQVVFTPTFVLGGNFTVIAFTDANGITQFATLNNAFTPAGGDLGLRGFNAAASVASATLLANGTVVGTSIPFGTANQFTSVPANTVDITWESGTTQLLDAGSLTLTAGELATEVLGPPAAGTTAFRSFVV